MTDKNMFLWVQVKKSVVSHGMQSVSTHVSSTFNMNLQSSLRNVHALAFRKPLVCEHGTHFILRCAFFGLWHVLFSDCVFTQLQFNYFLLIVHICLQ